MDRVLRDLNRNDGYRRRRLDTPVIELSNYERRQREDAENYAKYRGTCLGLSLAACIADSTLRLVRGHYFCPLWGSNEAHWWTERPDGSIHDPSKLQFPSRGGGLYEEFDGFIDCEQCGKRVTEEAAVIDGNHVFCSDLCYGRCVGIY